MTLRSDAKFEEKLICCFKKDKNLVKFDPRTLIFESSTLIGSFCAKCINFELKRYRGAIFHDPEE